MLHLLSYGHHCAVLNSGLTILTDGPGGLPSGKHRSDPLASCTTSHTAPLAVRVSQNILAAPAAIRTAVPEANPALSLTAALAVTFPFNIVVGIPLYERLAVALAG